MRFYVGFLIRESGHEKTHWVTYSCVLDFEWFLYSTLAVMQKIKYWVLSPFRKTAEAFANPFSEQ